MGNNWKLLLLYLAWGFVVLPYGPPVLAIEWCPRTLLWWMAQKEASHRGLWDGFYGIEENGLKGWLIQPWIPWTAQLYAQDTMPFGGSDDCRRVISHVHQLTSFSQSCDELLCVRVRWESSPIEKSHLALLYLSFRRVWGQTFEIVGHILAE